MRCVFRIVLCRNRCLPRPAGAISKARALPHCKKSNQTLGANLRPKPSEKTLAEGLAVADRGQHQCGLMQRKEGLAQADFRWLCPRRKNYGSQPASVNRPCVKPWISVANATSSRHFVFITAIPLLPLAVQSSRTFFSQCPPSRHTPFAVWWDITSLARLVRTNC